MYMIDSEINLGFDVDSSAENVDDNTNHAQTYADDIVFMSNDRDVLAQILKLFVSYTAMLGLLLNNSKSYMLATKHGSDEPDKSPLHIPDTDFILYFVESIIYLGYGIMADKPLNILDHLSLRDAKKNQKEGLKIAKKLR